MIYFLVRGRESRFRHSTKSWFTYVTALVLSETACHTSLPGRSNRTVVWISRAEIILCLLYWANRGASVANRSINAEASPSGECGYWTQAGEPTEHALDEAVHNRHGFARNTSTRMHLNQHSYRLRWSCYFLLKRRYLFQNFQNVTRIDFRS